MTTKTSHISRQQIQQLRRRAGLLAERIQSATARASDGRVRREGARFGEVLEEWVDSIESLYAAEDDELAERVKSFATRLKLAEAKLDNLGVPAPAPAPTPRGRAAAEPEPPPVLDDGGGDDDLAA